VDTQFLCDGHRVIAAGVVGQYHIVYDVMWNFGIGLPQCSRGVVRRKDNRYFAPGDHLRHSVSRAEIAG
jgi:hypothetical protein